MKTKSNKKTVGQKIVEECRVKCNKRTHEEREAGVKRALEIIESEKHAKKINVRLMWTCGEENVTTSKKKAKYYGGFFPVLPVLVIPFDLASRDVLVKQAAQWIRDETPGKAESLYISRAVLATLHPNFIKEEK